MPATRIRLVLWDVDHTLIESGGVGRELYRAAFEIVTGRPIEREADVTGRTETSILAETLRLHGIEPTDAVSQRYASELAAQYERHLDELRRRGRALPGAHATLTQLSRSTLFVQSVLTGNLRAVAVTKLRAFDLHHLVDFELGAYGDDDTDRSRLVAIAQRRAAAVIGRDFDAANTVVVGDTVHDVRAGNDGGAAVVAVASGGDSAQRLQEAGARTVLPDLTDPVAAEQAILSATHVSHRGDSSL